MQDHIDRESHNRMPDPANSLNRLQGISYDTSTADTTYTINAAASVSLEYMTTGDKSRVKKVITSGITEEENSYDTEGRISEYKLTLNSRTGYPFETDYHYDTASRLTKIEYPKRWGMGSETRKAVEPFYDVASRLTELKVDTVAQMNAIGYNVNGQVTALTTAPTTSNPRVEAYSYDAQTGLLTGQTVKNTAGSSTYLDLSYGYSRGNSKGSLNGKTGQLTSITDGLDHNKDRVYEHDALGRLIKAKGGQAAGATGVTANWTQDYSYDRYGNKTGTTATGITADSNNVPTDGLASLGYNTASNRINTSGWEYDLTGNLIRGQNASGVWQRFEYDAAGRLVKIKDDSNNVIETYTYGASRERLRTETSAHRTYYAGGGNPLVEYTEATASTTPVYSKSYVYAGSRLLSTATNVSGSEVVEFHHPDRLGTRLVTKPSDGSSFEQSTLPFGTALSAESTAFSNQVFTSYDRSAGTGLDYAVNRIYSQGQGRFTQVDPIGMAATSIDDPQSLNLYAYVANDPTNGVDPLGLDETRTAVQDAKRLLSSPLCRSLFPKGSDPGRILEQLDQNNRIVTSDKRPSDLVGTGIGTFRVVKPVPWGDRAAWGGRSGYRPPGGRRVRSPAGIWLNPKGDFFNPGGAATFDNYAPAPLEPRDLNALILIHELRHTIIGPGGKGHERKWDSLIYAMCFVLNPLWNKPVTMPPSEIGTTISPRPIQPLPPPPPVDLRDLQDPGDLIMWGGPHISDIDRMMAWHSSNYVPPPPRPTMVIVWTSGE